MADPSTAPDRSLTSAGDADDDGVDTIIHTESTQLERTIGLTGGLAIGIGTMIGAGIFVFPGLAAADAGPAAAISFAIGGIIALLVALPTSELATAMPKSGGGYYFVSRSLGTAYGAVVGLGLWLGLVFASAFYLIGLGFYVNAALTEVGIVLDISPVVPLGLLFGVALTALSVTGTKNTAALQSLIVGLLLIILTGFLSYGILDMLGLFGRSSVPEQLFLPAETALSRYLPVVSTAALVFTSYLGFAQVATVAGEIKSPARNLPLAMVGSVLIVALFYVVTIFVATSAFGSQQLGVFGETAMVEVARSFFGLGGAVAILIAGLLATFSSANASILSASRAVYATSRDQLLPQWASRLNRTYGTPHIALSMTAGPILVLVATGRVTTLAEVASFLHLVMYGLICISVLVLRRRDPDWYQPAFRTPAAPALPLLGAGCSFGLLVFMDPVSIVLGTLVMIGCYGWFRYYAKDVVLKDNL